MKCSICFSENTMELINSNKCFDCGTTQYFKNPVGRQKQSETKKAFSLRLSNDVIDVIRSKPNQCAYIEDLVRKNK